MLFLGIICIALFLHFCKTEKLDFLSDEFINNINRNQSHWIAGRNFPVDTPLDYLRGLGGAQDDPQMAQLKRKQTRVSHASRRIPVSFDARVNWPHCPSIKQIRNQSTCGSCWAFAVASTMTDRFCIASEGDIKFEFSPEELLTCCRSCFPKGISHGCTGGYAINGFSYFGTHGVVSGGDYTETKKKGCKPYSRDSYYYDEKRGHHEGCSTRCTNPNYKISYVDDKLYGEGGYYVDNQNLKNIQLEIMTYGPVVVRFMMYDDYFDYKQGVYQHVRRRAREQNFGFHAVKMIGWGVEKGDPYWLIANSWGTDWGGSGGFFKIYRGTGECYVEEVVCAGTPILDQQPAKGAPSSIRRISSSVPVFAMVISLSIIVLIV